jgi:hypothetical protein
MSPEERAAILQRRDVATCCSTRLRVATRRLRAAARAAQNTTALIRRKALVPHICGRGIDPVSERALKDKLASGLLPRANAMNKPGTGRAWARCAWRAISSSVHRTSR